eukprot:6478772-Amphidinium_carterae.1
MAGVKKSVLQLERERQERLDLSNAKRERAEIGKAVMDLSVMRDVKNYLMRKGVLDEEGKCVVGAPATGIARKGSTQSLGSDGAASECAETPRPRAQGAVEQPGEASSVSKLVRGGKLSGKSLRFTELSVHRNFATWGAVPPQLLRLLFGELCPGQLNFYALKASYSNMHQKEISRKVADELFEYLTGQRKETMVGEERDLPTLLLKMRGWHEQRGQPGLQIDGRCDWQQSGVYKVHEWAGDKLGTHLMVVDRIRGRQCHVPVTWFNGVSTSSLFVQTNYSDRHASIASIEQANLAINCWDLFGTGAMEATGKAEPVPPKQQPVLKKRRVEETC